jgi:hypothetical protein
MDVAKNENKNALQWSSPLRLHVSSPQFHKMIQEIKKDRVLFTPKITTLLGKYYWYSQQCKLCSTPLWSFFIFLEKLINFIFVDSSTHTSRKLSNVLWHRHVIHICVTFCRRFTSAWSNYCTLSNSTTAINHPVSCELPDKSQTQRSPICARFHSTAAMTSQTFNLIHSDMLWKKGHQERSSWQTTIVSPPHVSGPWKAANGELRKW